MIKLAAAVIKYEDKVLLMHRAQGQKRAGFWEFPSCKVAKDERLASALERGLDEDFNIKATIGKMITSLPTEKYEIYAYDVKYIDGLIKLYVHDNMEWVPLNEALTYNLVPADRKIIMHVTKTKENNTYKKPSLDDTINEMIEKPVLDTKTNRYVVKIKNALIGTTRSFINENQAMQFYIDTVRNMLKISKNQIER